MVDNVNVMNVAFALRGMRAPFKGYDKTDTREEGGEVKIGEDDLRIAKNLTSKTPEHRKFLRQIVVSMEVTAPRYWWSEFDTYKYADKNSESTMHTITKKKIEYSDFEPVKTFGVKPFFKEYINQLNWLVEQYIDTGDNAVFEDLKRLLPEGYLQKRFITTNFETLISMYRQRKSHRLSAWRKFFKELFEAVPLLKEFAIFV